MAKRKGWAGGPPCIAEVGWVLGGAYPAAQGWLAVDPSSELWRVMGLSALFTVVPNLSHWSIPIKEQGVSPRETF